MTIDLKAIRKRIQGGNLAESWPVVLALLDEIERLEHNRGEQHYAAVTETERQHYRERAEVAEAEVARLTALLQDVAE